MTTQNAPAAKSMVGDGAKRVLAQVEHLVRRAAQLQALPAELRERARQQAFILTSERVNAALRAIPLLSLKGAAGRGARLQQAVDGGFRTVADVVAGGPQRLVSVPGIGPQSAQQIHQAATATAGGVVAETRLVIDPERRDSPQTALLATLAATTQVDASMPTLRQPIAALLDQARPLMAAAERTTSRSRMLFAGRNTKNDALVALGHLQSLLADPGVAALSRTIDEHLRACNIENRDVGLLWADYLANAAGLATQARPRLTYLGPPPRVVAGDPGWHVTCFTGLTTVLLAVGTPSPPVSRSATRRWPVGSPAGWTGWGSGRRRRPRTRCGTPQRPRCGRAGCVSWRCSSTGRGCGTTRRPDTRRTRRPGPARVPAGS